MKPVWVWKVLQSIRVAFEGFTYTVRTQRNMRIHLVASVIVITASLLLHVEESDFLSLLFAIVLVLAAELFNTSIEAVVDLVSPQYNRLAKVAKDTAAAAVLLAAAHAVVVGFFVFRKLL